MNSIVGDLAVNVPTIEETALGTAREDVLDMGVFLASLVVQSCFPTP